jgi:hypothetical protein
MLMFRSFVIFVMILGLLALASCANQSQFLDNKQGIAMETVLSQGRFDLNCQQVSPVLISREVVQPVLQGPFVNGIDRAEFTIGVEGCGKRHSYVVICPDGNAGGFAAGPGAFHNW